MEYRMNVGKSLKNDYYLGVSLLSCVLFLGILIYFVVTKVIDFEVFSRLSVPEIINTAEFQLLVIFVLLLCVGAVSFIKRLLYIQSFENSYRTVNAHVVDIHYIKDRCKVWVEFNYNGEINTQHFMLFNNQQTKYIHIDSEVKLLIKNENPKTSLILELYFE